MGLFSKKKKEVLTIDEEQAFVIAGINKYGLTPWDCGTFKGWVFRDKDNKYDDNAVAVFKGEQLIGYLYRAVAANNAENIESYGGQVPAIVKIERKYDEDKGSYYLFGLVQILWPDTE